MAGWIIAIPATLIIIIIMIIIVVCFKKDTPQQPVTPALALWSIRASAVLNFEVRRTIINNCVSASRAKDPVFVVSDWKSNGELSVEKKVEEREWWFGRIVNEEIRELLALQKDIQYLDKWDLEGSICNFALCWSGGDGRKHVIIIESQYAHCQTDHWRNKQIDAGIEKLNQNSEIVKKLNHYQLELSVLVVNFPIPRMIFAKLEPDTIILHESMIEAFMVGVDVLKSMHDREKPKKISA